MRLLGRTTQVNHRFVDDLDASGSANQTRLTVLKKWFERPGRLPAFGLWVARRSAGRKGKTRGAAGGLLDEGRRLLGTDGTGPAARPALQSMHDRARALQNDREEHRWTTVRIVNCWQLLLVEKGLVLFLAENGIPSAGYELAADYCTHYDPRFGHGLNGPSRAKIMEIVRYMFTVEALEDLKPSGSRPRDRRP